MKYLDFVPHEKLDDALDRRVSAYRERVVGKRHMPEPVYGTLEMRDDHFILRDKGGIFIKLEEGEGVFVT